jgi:hypothetical protein
LYLFAGIFSRNIFKSDYEQLVELDSEDESEESDEICKKGVLSYSYLDSDLMTPEQ